ncbi:PHP domain-containing protein [Stenomitos frigidus]|uniref:PHP domain-containing protein n=1 Tax=Stenomitos frigidus ULC18 TaxID=2107698 RepID=A0A2T1E2P7_9CYAN|nr:PHP domain-containing protein [Stenomitos frigidus]PSB27018.1 PHP domain-containing protein [Stenomitos frigidus ULC18]
MAVELAPASNPLIPAARDVTALRHVFEQVHAGSCPTSFNFHMHTVNSDGQLRPEALMQQAIAIGLQGFAITDHHSVNGYRIAQRWLDEQHLEQDRFLPHLWVGVEVTSRLLDTEVHILGYAFDPESPAMQRYLQRHAPQGEDAKAERVISAIHQAGGLAVLAHPVRYKRSPEDLIPQAAQFGIDGVEAYYAYNNPNPWQTSPEQTGRVQRLSAAFNLLNTCGTDTHGLSLLQRL